MCEHQQRSIKHGHNNIMWLIFFPLHSPPIPPPHAFCRVHIANDYTKLLMVNHNGLGVSTLLGSLPPFRVPRAHFPSSPADGQQGQCDTHAFPKWHRLGPRVEAAALDLSPERPPLVSLRLCERGYSGYPGSTTEHQADDSRGCLTEQ